MSKVCGAFYLLLASTFARAIDCTNIPVNHTAADVRVYAKDFAASLQTFGQPNPMVEYELGRAVVSHIRVKLDEVDGSPVQSAIGFVATHSTGKVKAAEYGPQGEPEWSTVDGLVLNLGRKSVDGYDTPFFAPAFSMTLSKEDGIWYALNVRIFPSAVLADAGTINSLRTCTEGAVPQERMQIATFNGLVFNQCDIVGKYEYTAKASDEVAFTSGARWVAMKSPDSSSPKLSWRIVRKASLTIAPGNFWPDISKSDCFCHDKAGYELDIDVITGEVIHYQPGIGCVVC